MSTLVTKKVLLITYDYTPKVPRNAKPIEMTGLFNSLIYFEEFCQYEVDFGNAVKIEPKETKLVTMPNNFCY